MSIFRRHILESIARGTAPSYITDGLLFHLDGINKGDTADAWTDLINAIVFSNYGCTSIDKGLAFYGSSYLLSTTPGWQWWRDNIKTELCTIEIVFKAESLGDYCLFNPQAEESPSLWIMNNGAKLVYGYYNRRVTYDYNAGIGNQVVSVNSHSAIQNGQQLSATTNSSSYTNLGVSIGCRYNGSASYYFNGEIYSIRIYNRQLTADEMLNNQRVDNARFNLGLDL